MSGEAGGALVGSVALLSVAPIIMAGAAAAGVAYGAYKASSVLGKYALKYAGYRHRQKKIAVNQCSEQLKGLYSQMQEAADRQADVHAAYARQLSGQFHALGEQMDKVRQSRPTAGQLDEHISASRETIQQSLHAQGELAREKMMDIGTEAFSRCIEENEKSIQQKSELVQWAQQNAAAISMQKSAASEMLRDAEASVRLLESMGGPSDGAFRKRGAHMGKAILRAKDMFAQGMYQAAYSDARSVIRESAKLVAGHVQEQAEMDTLEMELRVKLESLHEEMQAQRVIEFRDGTRRDNKLVKADLNNFSQGKYKQMLSQIEAQLAYLDRVQGNLTAYGIKEKLKQFDQELEPQARHIISSSYKIMDGYYQRLHVMEVVADFMGEQDYAMDWAMPVGGDASQKLVVHFVQKITGNTVSVTLENDWDCGDAANMAMEVLTFYGKGREVTEREKQELREHLTKALNQAGLSGALGCTGHVGQPSGQMAMDQKEAVKNMRAETVI